MYPSPARNRLENRIINRTKKFWNLCSFDPILRFSYTTICERISNLIRILAIIVHCWWMGHCTVEPLNVFESIAKYVLEVIQRFVISEKVFLRFLRSTKNKEYTNYEPKCKLVDESHLDLHSNSLYTPDFNTRIYVKSYFLRYVSRKLLESEEYL